MWKYLQLNTFFQYNQKYTFAPLGLLIIIIIQFESQLKCTPGMLRRHPSIHYTLRLSFQLLVSSPASSAHLPMYYFRIDISRGNRSSTHSRIIINTRQRPVLRNEPAAAPVLLVVVGWLAVRSGEINGRFVSWTFASDRVASIHSWLCAADSLD